MTKVLEVCVTGIIEDVEVYVCGCYLLPFSNVMSEP
jgi:hypothetical protein